MKVFFPGFNKSDQTLLSTNTFAKALTVRTFLNHRNNGPCQLLIKDPTTQIKVKVLKELACH